MGVRMMTKKGRKTMFIIGIGFLVIGVIILSTVWRSQYYYSQTVQLELDYRDYVSADCRYNKYKGYRVVIDSRESMTELVSMVNTLEFRRLHSKTDVGRSPPLSIYFERWGDRNDYIQMHEEGICLIYDDSTRILQIWQLTYESFERLIHYFIENGQDGAERR